MKVLLLTSNTEKNKNVRLSSQTIKAGKNQIHISFEELTIDISDTQTTKMDEIGKQIKSSLQSSTALILYASLPTHLLSYTIALASLYEKPVLILAENSTYYFSFEHPKVYIRSYRNTHEIQRIVDSFSKTLADLQFTKFNFIIPAELDDYLEWTSRYRKKPKSEIARQAIQKIMETDADYLLLRGSNIR